jgi:hypothetical protein
MWGFQLFFFGLKYDEFGGLVYKNPFVQVEGSIFYLVKFHHRKNAGGE